MKFFAVFAAVVAVACAVPSTWTMTKLSEAIQNPTTSSTLKPVLEQALDAYMDAIYSGNYQESITISTTAGVTGTFTLAQLDLALLDPTISSSIFKPYLVEALNEMMSALFAGEQKETIEVYVPAFQLSYLSLQELDNALTAATNPALVSYLENALNNLMFHLVNGGKQHSILVAVPADIVAESTAVAPSPVAVIPTPVDLAPSPVAVIPSPVAVAPSPVSVVPGSPAAPTAPLSVSPLVQIVVNVNQQSNAAGVITPAHVIDRPTPEQTISPVIDRPTPEQTISPVIDRPTPEQTIVPTPIVDRPTPEQTIVPTPIIDRPTPESVPVNPIDVIAVLPVESLEPSPVAIQPMLV